ncbi:hypothetical protein OAN47_04055, partial [Planctomycetota bacterium]|nr:hypothetical protein [Planctomycetota bacterium]
MDTAKVSITSHDDKFSLAIPAPDSQNCACFIASSGQFTAHASLLPLRSRDFGLPYQEKGRLRRESIEVALLIQIVLR